LVGLAPDSARAQPATADQVIEAIEKRLVKRTPAKIVGGVPATDGEFPWQAGIAPRNAPDRTYCGGAFIRPNIVLTAAHCVVGGDNSALGGIRNHVVISGAAKLGDPRMVSYDITDVLVHPRYSQLETGGLDYDFALIRVAQRFTGRPIELVSAAENAAVTVNMPVQVTGWGRVQPFGNQATELQKLTVYVVSRADCNNAASHNGVITSRMLCAGVKEGDKGACQGDSGGPLTAPVGPDGARRLIGVVSWGDPACTVKNKPAIYGRVHEMRSWIESAIAFIEQPIN
jgi:secreted trypsin-like serine protease